MNGTALYRALVHAGAPEDEAKEVADGIDDSSKTTKEQLTNVEVRLARVENHVKNSNWFGMRRSADTDPNSLCDIIHIPGA